MLIVTASLILLLKIAKEDISSCNDEDGCGGISAVQNKVSHYKSLNKGLSA